MPVVVRDKECREPPWAGGSLEVTQGQVTVCLDTATSADQIAEIVSALHASA